MNQLTLKTFFSAAILAPFISAAWANPFPSSGPIVPGNTARLHYGSAWAPAQAPPAVQRAIWAANQLSSLPYRYGGGHRSFSDSAYDCSGTVSYALGAAGLVRSPMSSRELRHFGRRGRGKWITVYANKGHTFAVIAGLRLDTTDLGRGGDVGPRWYDYSRDSSGYVARHPVGM